MGRKRDFGEEKERKMLISALKTVMERATEKQKDIFMRLVDLKWMRTYRIR